MGLCLLSPSPSTSLGCIPPPQMGHSPSLALHRAQLRTHTRQFHEARGEPTALGYLHPVPPENWPLPSAILKTLQSPFCDPERQAEGPGKGRGPGETPQANDQARSQPGSRPHCMAPAGAAGPYPDAPCLKWFYHNRWGFASSPKGKTSKKGGESISL